MPTVCHIVRSYLANLSIHDRADTSSIETSGLPTHRTYHNTTPWRKPCAIVIVETRSLRSLVDVVAKLLKTVILKDQQQQRFKSRSRSQRLPSTTITARAPLVGSRLSSVGPVTGRGGGIVAAPRAIDSAGIGICTCTCVPASRFFLGGRLLASNDGVTDCRGLASNRKMHRKGMLLTYTSCNCCTAHGCNPVARDTP
jgi:hypothetical protein